MGNKHLLLRSFFICFSDSGIKQCWIAIIFILTQVICISCDRTLSQESIIDLYPEVISSPDLGTKVTAIDYVRLETKSNCNIGYIAKLMVVKDYILINNSGKQIVCFDLKGKFLLNIGQQGRGPGEYERIRDFTYDQASNKVYVLSSMNSIMVYTMGGEFIERIETQEGYATSIEVLNDKIVLHYDNSSGKSINRIAIYTANGEFLKNYQNQYLFDIEGPVISYLHECIFYKTSDWILLKELHSDTLFRVAGLDLVPYKIYYTKNHSFTAEVRGSRDYPENESSYMQINQIFETKNYLYSFYQFDKENFISIFDLNTHKNEIIQHHLYEPNSFDGGLAIYPKGFGSIGGYNYIIKSFSPHELKRHLLKESVRNFIPKFPEKKNELVQIASNLNDDDNPVLMLIRLK